MTTMTATRRLAGPSAWVDRLTAGVAARGIPEAVAYPLAGLGLFVLATVTQWAAGSYAVGTVSRLHLVMAGAIAFLVWMIAAINRSAGRAMDRVRPLLAVDDATYEELRHAVVDTPGGLDLGIALLWAVGATLKLALDPTALPTADLAGTGPGVVAGAAVLILFVVAASAYVVKVAHLAWAIRRVSSGDMTVSLWELGSLHGFSILTGQMALGIVVAVVGLFLARRGSAQDPSAVTGALAGLTVAAGVFVLPLLRIHDRLVGEKARLRGAAARTMEEAVTGLHTAITANDLAAMDAHYKAVAAVEVEMRTIAGIPTWPWLPDTFRWVVGALMFPIVLFVIQYVIGRLFST